MMKFFRKFRELSRDHFATIRLNAGDSLQITYHDVANNETILSKTTINAEQAMVIDESVLFEAIVEGRRAPGGYVLEESR